MPMVNLLNIILFIMAHEYSHIVKQPNYDRLIIMCLSTTGKIGNHCNVFFHSLPIRYSKVRLLSKYTANSRGFRYDRTRMMD